MILDSVYKLSEQLGLDPTLNVIIAEIILNKYDPDSVDGDKIRGSVVKSTKMLVQHFFPNFSNEILDGLLHVVIKMNPESLIPICKKLRIPEELIKLITSFLSKEEYEMLDMLRSILKIILPQQYYKFF